MGEVDQSFTFQEKTLRIKLSDFTYSGNANESNGSAGKNKDYFIGRKEDIKKFCDRLNDKKSGAYLVTGYRGMGKTSFVNKVLSEIVADSSDKINYIVYLSYFCFIIYGFVFSQLLGSDLEFHSDWDYPKFCVNGK